MKKIAQIVATAVFVSFVCSAFAEDVRDPQDFRAQVRIHKDASVESGGSLDIESGGSLKIGGTAVTATAAQLNAAGGGSATTLTPTVVSNATLTVYGSNLTVKAGGSVTVPAGSIAAAALGTGLTDAQVSDNISVSNITGQVYCSNLVVKAGGTVAVPAASIATASLAGTLYSAVLVTDNGLGTNWTWVVTNGCIMSVTKAP